MEKLNLNPNVAKQEEDGVAGEVGETLTIDGGTISDSGSTASSRSSRPGPKSSKVSKVGISGQEGLSPPPPGTKKRKDTSPLLGAGKSIAPDKKRKKKVWKRLQVTDRDSGSEPEPDSEEDATPRSEAASDSSAGRAARAARREQLASVKDQAERKLEESRPESPDLDKLDLKSLQELGKEWLDGIDVARRRSSNLKGDLSGQIKKFVDKSKELFEVLVSRLSDKGDASFLRAQVTELTAQLRAIKCDEEARSREIISLRREIEILRNSMQPGSSRDAAQSEGGSDTRVADKPSIKSVKGPSTRTAEEPKLGLKASKVIIDRLVPPPLPQRPPRVIGSGTKQVRSDREKDLPRGRSIESSPSLLGINPVTASDIDDASIDEILYNLIELRNARRPDLPKIPNPFRSNLSVIPPPDPSVPPKRGRGRPRIIRDVQLVPPRGTSQGLPVSGSDTGGTSTPRVATNSDGQPEWTTVTKRRRARRRKGAGSVRSNVDFRHPGGAASTSRVPPYVQNQKKRRPPRTAAVTITGAGESFSYASVLKKAREEISLTDLGIEKSRIRRTINGVRIIEIPGLDAADKADKLASQLRSVLGAEVTVARPTVKGELRVIGLDDTATTEEVIKTVATLGGCSADDIKTGSIRQLSNGMGAIWVQCPLAAANKVGALKRIGIGWTMARVELLAARPTQCYKCWRYGHTRFNCGSQLNLFGLCFRCGAEGHAARHCSATPKCLPCDLEKLNSAHRFGSTACCVKSDPVVTSRINPLVRRTEDMDVDPPNNG